MDAVQQAPVRETGKLAQVREFMDAVVAEMKKVTWPSKPELIKATRMIVIVSMVLGVVIGLLDWMLQKILVDGVAALAR
jgi:preprotein translocase subunit SecE